MPHFDASSARHSSRRSRKWILDAWVPSFSSFFAGIFSRVACFARSSLLSTACSRVVSKWIEKKITPLQLRFCCKRQKRSKGVALEKEKKTVEHCWVFDVTLEFQRLSCRQSWSYFASLYFCSLCQKCWLLHALLDVISDGNFEQVKFVLSLM